MTQTETIDKRIDELEAEMATLTTNHDNVVKQFNQIVSQNQTRFAQLKGGVAELQKLKEQNNDNTTSNGEHSISIGGIPDPGDRAGNNRRSGVVHRKLDKPAAASR